MRRYKSPPAGRPPRATSNSVSKSMKSNRSSGTKPEMVLSRMLRKRITKNRLPGSPDFVFPRKKVAVFLHGCFWHRCPTCDLSLPKANADFWARKFQRNVERDRFVRAELESSGWKVVEIWEHELRTAPTTARRSILLKINGPRWGVSRGQDERTQTSWRILTKGGQRSLSGS